MTREAAERMAIQALSFMAETPEEFARFLALSGLDPTSIRAAAAEPGFLGGVLTYLCEEEARLLAFARHGGIDPADVARARAALAGPDWEHEHP